MVPGLLNEEMELALMSNPGYMVQRSNEKKSMNRTSLHILTQIISNNTDFRASDTKAADFKLFLPIQW